MLGILLAILISNWIPPLSTFNNTPCTANVPCRPFNFMRYQSGSQAVTKPEGVR